MNDITVTTTVNGRTEQLRVDAAVTLLDALRDRLGPTGTKKTDAVFHTTGRRVRSLPLTLDKLL